MKFTPNYTVSYHGMFHPAGKQFDISDVDATEMRKHGTVEVAGAPEQPAAKKPGRPKKTE